MSGTEPGNEFTDRQDPTEPMGPKMHITSHWERLNELSLILLQSHRTGHEPILARAITDGKRSANTNDSNKPSKGSEQLQMPTELEGIESI